MSNSTSIQFLPPKLSAKDFFNTIKKVPPFFNSKTPIGNINRSLAINQIKTHWFHVNEFHYSIYEHIYDVIYNGYSVRDMVGDLSIIENTIEWHKHCKDVQFTPAHLPVVPADGLTLLGVSGVGKSTLLARILSTCFPQVIKKSYREEIGYIYLICQASIKTLCLTFFQAVDKVIGTDYWKEYSRNYTVDNLIPAMATVAAIHKIGVLVIDELSNLNSARGSTHQEVLRFFKNLNISIGMPLIYVGSPEAEKILAGNFQVARRAQGLAAIRWDRLMEDDHEWDRLIKILWKLQVLKKPGEITKEIKSLYYELSQGVLDCLVMLHMGAQQRALTLGAETLSVEIIRQVPIANSSLTSPILKGLSRKDVATLQHYRDLSFRSHAIEDEMYIQSHNKADLLASIFSGELSKEEAEACLKYLVAKFPNLNNLEIIAKARRVANKIKPRDKNPIRKKLIGSTPVKSEIIDLAKQKSQSSFYEQLVKGGYIKALLDIIKHH